MRRIHLESYVKPSEELQRKANRIGTIAGPKGQGYFIEFLEQSNASFANYEQALDELELRHKIDNITYEPIN